MAIIQTTEQDVSDLLFKVDISKACGHDGIGNKILKLCRPGISKTLTQFINLSLQLGEYPTEWKKANIIPIYKKENRQHKNNYRPIALLPSISKIQEKIVFKNLYDFLINVGFLNKFQSGFRPGDGTINQLSYIIHTIYQALDMGKEIRMVFLGLSKAFDKVWHKGLIHKLENLGVRDPLLSWFRTYLSNRIQRVTIEGHCSPWLHIESGVPQGSVLGPLLFLIYINDICEDVESSYFLYADDTSLLDIVDDPIVSASKLDKDLEKINTWCKNWLMDMNPSKCETITFSTKHLKPIHPNLSLDNQPLREVTSHTHLGLTLLSNLSWSQHIFGMHKKASKKLNVLKSMKYRLDRSTLISLYKSLIRPVMEYADVIWDGCSEYESNILEGIQYEAARVVTGAIKGTSKDRLLNSAGKILKLEDIYIRCFSL